ncbi:MAG: hypothetical protein NVSMB12_03250 [Acidimicrobiales bacterium]
MVPLAPVPSEFAGRVLVAKLGSAGIIAELRGVSRVYPTVFDNPEVWVEAGELADARELITADLDDELAADPPDARRPIVGARSPVRAVLVAVALVLLAALSIGPRACAPVTRTPSAPVR